MIKVYGIDKGGKKHYHEFHDEASAKQWAKQNDLKLEIIKLKQTEQE